MYTMDMEYTRQSLFGSNAGGNPGYGNDYNVGFSPGIVGGAPAGFNKFIYQQQLYEQMYGPQTRATFARYPLISAAIWTPFGLLLSAFFGLLGFTFIKGSWGFGVLAGIVGTIVIGGAAVFIIYRLTVAVWIAALILHRRANGQFSNRLEWADEFEDVQKYPQFNRNFIQTHPQYNEWRGDF